MNVVATWLCELGLEQYIPAFEDNDVDAQTLRKLTESDLAAMGIVSVGHRRKLATAISALAAPTPGPGVAAPAPQTALEAERRQLSVLCCDMVGSTALSQRLDAEDYREVIRSFHDSCMRTVAEYDGWVANFIGDCVLVYFGWPRAHEDDVERAVRTGLALVQVVSGSSLAVRVGIATGSEVVGDLIREGPAQEQSAVGVTPDLAAHLQTLAAPGQVAIDELTRRLLGSSFMVQPLGAHALKRLPEPATAYAVSGEQSADSRFDARTGKDVPPMIGRDQEMVLLKERWAQAQGGEGLALLLVGEAGIGKSRLVRALLDACATQPHQLVRWQCSPYHSGSALWPVIQRLGRATGLAAEDSTDAALDKLEAVAGQDQAAALYATLLGLNGTQRYGPLEMTPQMLRDRTLELMAEQLFEMAAQRPLLLVLEDAHWIDPTTLELIERCLGKIDRASMLILITSRPDKQPELGAHPSVSRLSLNRLSRASVEKMVARLGGDGLQAHTMATIVAQTDGVPLFVEELTKAVLETGEAAIPASLHGSLMARLDRIAEVKEVAQIAACIGREFDQALLQAVAEQPETVAAAMDKLVAAELVFRRDSRTLPKFTFKHALVQEAAYESLLRSRRQELHARILRTLAAASPAGAPEVLAHHAARAGLAVEAIGYWQQAGAQATAKSAFREATSHFTAAIELLETQPPGDAQRALELDLHLALGQSLLASQGHSASATRKAYARALALLDELPNPTLQTPVFYGVWAAHYTRGEMAPSLRLAKQFAATVATGSDDAARVVAYRAVGSCLWNMGRFADARQSLEQAVAAYDPARHPGLTAQFGQEIGSVACSYLGWALSLLGFPDQARASVTRAHACIAAVTHIHALALHQFFSTFPSVLLRDVAAVRHSAERLAALAGTHGLLQWQAMSTLLRGWVLLESGERPAEAADQLIKGLREFAATGALVLAPFFRGGVACALGRCQRHEDALEELQRAIVESDETDQVWCAAELWRVRGELLLCGVPNDAAEAERCFERALCVARAQGARLWELRTATSLARLLAAQGARERACTLLGPVNAWFTEGFGCADLVDARTLLEELALR